MVINTSNIAEHDGHKSILHVNMAIAFTRHRQNRVDIKIAIRVHTHTDTHDEWFHSSYHRGFNRQPHCAGIVLWDVKNYYRYWRFDWTNKKKRKERNEVQLLIVLTKQRPCQTSHHFALPNTFFLA